MNWIKFLVAVMMFSLYPIEVSFPMNTPSDQICLEYYVNNPNVSFDTTYQILMHHEGHYALVQHDRGRETYAGITRRYNADWEGWKIIDQHKRSIGRWRLENNTYLRELDPWVYAHYYAMWISDGFDMLEDQEVANYLFDFRVNVGSGIKIIQEVLNNLGHCIKIDGRMGAETIEAINGSDKEQLLVMMRDRRIQHYYRIVAHDSTQKKFLNHWLYRAKRVDV